MINLKNSLILAHTKLKSRKIRAVVTIVISSLLFSLLMLAVVLFEGVYKTSFDKFSKGSINARNMIKAAPLSAGRMMNKISLDEKKQLDKMLDEEIMARKKRSKELNLEFDEKTERKNLVPYQPDDEQNPKEFFVDISNPIALRFINHKVKDDFTKLHGVASKLASETKADKLLYAINLTIGSGNSLFIKSGQKYQFEKNTKPDNPVPGKNNSLELDSLNLLDRDIYQHFLLPNSKWNPQSGKIPLILPVNQVESLLALKPLSKKATLKQKISRLEEIKNKAADLEIKTCSLNSLAMSQLQEANDFEKKSKEEQKNTQLVYGKLTGESCSVPQVIKDTRNKEAKKEMANQLLFGHEFNKTPLSAQAIELTFQIVGVLPAEADYQSQDFVDNLVRMVIGYDSIGNVIPRDMLFQLPQFSQFKDIYSSYFFSGDSKPIINAYSQEPVFYLEYSTPELVRSVVDNFSCDFGSIDSFNGDLGPLGTQNNCHGVRGFYLATFGSRAADLIKVRQVLTSGLKIAGVAFALVASIIMAGTVGRLISDSRRETAVFRAIGFKRFDISAVYASYMMIICVLTIAVSFGIAVMIASVLDFKLSEELTAQMIWLYSPQDAGLRFSLIGFNWQYLGAISLVIMLVGLISLILPLMRNIRRNPIRDMRDE